MLFSCSLGTSVRLQKNKNRIKKIIEEFVERGNNYFKHCNKEKIETIGTWCKQLINNQSKMVKNTKILNNVEKTTVLETTVPSHCPTRCP